MVVDPPRSSVPPIPSAEDLFLRRQADLAHREWRVEVKSALSDHPDFASSSFAESFPALWNRGLAAFPHPQDVQEEEWRTKVLKATLPYLLRHGGSRAEVRRMDPVVQNLLDHIERAERDVRDTTAAATGYRESYRMLEQQVRDRTRDLDQVTKAVDAVEALAREVAKARGLKGSAVFKFVRGRVAEHEAKVEARTKDLASLGEDLTDLSAKIANLTDDLVTAKQVRDDFRHELFETRYPLPAPPPAAPSTIVWSPDHTTALGTVPFTAFNRPAPRSPSDAPKPAPKPVPKKKKAPKTKGKGKARAAPMSAPESPPLRSPSPAAGPSKRPAPTSGDDSEPIAIRRPKRSRGSLSPPLERLRRRNRRGGEFGPRCGPLQAYNPFPDG
ncbi:hypothetical protein HGRIS_002841 [Hohenbuehelia grisea]|uniref:Uncharacterized protein n=1 Tax=Hohenbuehelia grisea TaxID=104357 RepID=A0ABR3JLP2_9AGAR